MKTIQFFACALLALVLIVGPDDLGAQNPQTCKLIDQIKAEATAAGKGGAIKITFPDGATASDFKINLFAPRKNDNKLGIKTPEISGLSKGTYYLIIQSADGGDCTRKITLEIN